MVGKLLLLVFADTGKTQAEVCDTLANDFKIQNAADLVERSIDMGGLAQQYMEVDYESAQADMTKLYEEIEQLNKGKAYLNVMMANKDQMITEMQNKIAGLKERISQLEDKA